MHLLIPKDKLLFFVHPLSFIKNFICLLIIEQIQKIIIMIKMVLKDRWQTKFLQKFYLEEQNFEFQ